MTNYKSDNLAYCFKYEACEVLSMEKYKIVKMQLGILTNTIDNIKLQYLF